MSTVTDEIKARVDLVDLIGRVVQLRKSGSNSFKGLCPFHQEKTPSFYVFPESHTWVCFGCQKKGTAFDWLMEREHLEFGEALRTLAQMTGVELPRDRSPEREEQYARILDLLARTQTYYQAALQGTAGMAARRYLAGRGVSEETMSTFGLGFAPSGNALLHYLKEQGFTEDEMVEAAVVNVADDGHHFDFFRDRVLFPIRDQQGRTVAFGGRAVGDGTPKYLNSRDTALFHKQETLFAIDVARKPIAQARRAVVVEGYMDAIMAHQHGHRNVVATLGTAVTDRHLVLLRRIADEIVLALDSDAAGQAATWRTLQVAEQSLAVGARPVMGPNKRRTQLVPDHAAQLKVLSIPSAKDPDELIRSDPGAWPALVESAKPVADFVLAQLGSRHDLATAKGKADAAVEAAEVLAGIANPIEQDHYVQRVAAMLGVGESAVRQTLKGRRPNVAQPATPPAAAEEPSNNGSVQAPAPNVFDDPLEEYALALFMAAREQAPRLLLGREALELSHPESRTLLEAIATSQPDTLRQRLDPTLIPLVERVTSRRAGIDRYSDPQLEREIRDASLRLEERALLIRKRQVHDLMRGAENEEERRAWTGELARLAARLNEIEEQLRDERPVLISAGAGGAR